MFLLPVGRGGWQQPPSTVTQNGTFTLQNVAPGDYVALAYAGGPQDLGFGDEESVKRLESQGQAVHLEAGEKVSVKLKVVGSQEE